MTISLTDAAQAASELQTIEPNLILEIEGFDTLFGNITIQETITYGTSGLTFGSGQVYGGLTAIENQDSLITFDGTSTSINQQLRPDDGNISSVSSLTVTMIDKDLQLSKLISPGVEIDDILGAKATIYFGFNQTAWPQDYIVIFKGQIQEVQSGPGNVALSIVHPDEKKRQQIFTSAETNLDGSIDASTTSITVESNAQFLEPVAGPDASFDPAIKFYMRIDDEVIEYTSKSGSTTYGGVVRGALGTTAAIHDDEASVTSFYVLEDSAMDLALKIMLSGVNGNWVEDQAITNFNEIDASLNVPNAIFFADVDLETDFGLAAGDYVTITGATNAANNVSAKTVASIVKSTSPVGSYAIINGVTFVTEAGTSAVVDFRSQFDTLGEGLAMTPDEVDVDRHVSVKNLFLNVFNFRFYLRETVDAKEFLNTQIYGPSASYAVPRKGRASVAYTIGPIPIEDIKTLDDDNIRSPDKIKLKRRTSRYFNNEVVHKFDESVLEADKYLAGNIRIDADSKNRIPVGRKTRTFESKGLRSDLSGLQLADDAAERLLARYKFGAEHFEGVKIFYKTGFNLEPADLVILDPENMQITNTADGTRQKPDKFFEIINKKLDFKSGDVTVALVDTNFGTNERYGTIAPSTNTDTGSTTTVLKIKDSFGDLFPGNEKKKWEDYVGLPIRVHSEDFTFDEETTLISFNPSNPNEMNVSPALSGAPPADYVIDLPAYESSDPTANRLHRLFHAFYSPRVLVTSGASGTVFDVGGGDIAKFFVGGTVLVHTSDFVTASSEVQVTDVTGTTVTVGTDLGFTPVAGYEVDFIGFPDESEAYRII